MRSLLLASAALFAACASPDASADRATVHDDVLARTNATANAPESPLADADLQALLREPLTAATAVQVTLLNNHRVRATYQRLGIAKADLVQAGLLRNPTLDVSIRRLEGGGLDSQYGLPLRVLDLFWQPLRENLAAHEFTAAKLRITEELVHLVFAVRRAHAEAQAAEALAAVHRRMLATAEAAHELMVELHAAGNATDRQLAEARVGESRARLDLATAEQDTKEAREPLQTLLGLWGQATEWTLADTFGAPLPTLDLEHVESRAIATSLALQAHRAGLDALAQQVGLDDWRGWFPDLAFGPNVISNPNEGTGYGARAALDLPLFDDGSTRVARDQAQLAAGLHDHVQLAVEIRSAARLLRDRVTMLTERERFLREVHLPARKAAVRTTTQSYNAMQIGAFDVLEAQQLLLADERDQANTALAAWRAVLDLQQLLAGSQPSRALDRLGDGRDAAIATRATIQGAPR